MAAPTEPVSPILPFPVFRVSKSVERYLLYDINIITWLRKTHHILGVLIGTLPQIPQQNVFLGLPLELMPEETKLLSEKGLAYIVDDRMWHRTGLQSTTAEQREAFRQGLLQEGRKAARAAEQKKLERTERATGRLQISDPTVTKPTETSQADKPPDPGAEDPDSLFDSPITQKAPRLSTSASHSSLPSSHPWTLTPTTSYPPLPPPPLDPSYPLPTVNPASYALFHHLHAQDYFMSPGLRFGCHFLVYPGDPLRFHSHFLAVGADWDEEIALLDIIGGGRLGTGVKKGWLVGGMEGGSEEAQSERANAEDSREDKGKRRVRTFCIEWGGM
ncbi:MAG: hypothetical protein Q9187_008114 [Circinaria calcarea]